MIILTSSALADTKQSLKVQIAKLSVKLNEAQYARDKMVEQQDFIEAQVIQNCIVNVQSDKKVLEEYLARESFDEISFILQKLQEGISVSKIHEILTMETKCVNSDSGIVLTDTMSSEVSQDHFEDDYFTIPEDIEIADESDFLVVNDQDVEDLLSETCNNEFNDLNQIDYPNNDCKYNVIQDVQATTNSDMNSSKLCISNTEDLYETNNYDANQTKMDNLATDMKTGLLMEYRPHGNGYPSWVGDWITVGEPVN